MLQGFWLHCSATPQKFALGFTTSKVLEVLFTRGESMPPWSVWLMRQRILDALQRDWSKPPTIWTTPSSSPGYLIHYQNLYPYLPLLQCTSTTLVLPWMTLRPELRSNKPELHRLPLLDIPVFAHKSSTQEVHLLLLQVHSKHCGQGLLALRERGDVIDDSAATGGGFVDARMDGECAEVGHFYSRIRISVGVLVI